LDHLWCCKITTVVKDEAKSKYQTMLASGMQPHTLESEWKTKQLTQTGLLYMLANTKIQVAKPFMMASL
jgi:hypothetical protein